MEISPQVMTPFITSRAKLHSPKHSEKEYLSASCTDVTEVVKKLLGHKEAGVDDIHLGMLIACLVDI